jgi:hypothetical protein
VAPTSDAAFLVLHVLRVKGIARVEEVAATTRLPTATVEAELQAAAAAGSAKERGGRLPGWSLTGDGRRRHRALACLDVGRVARPVLDDAYRRVLALNPELLATCTAWQLREVDGERVVNDHADAAHDAAVLARLERVHDEVRPVYDALAAVLDRFAAYGPELDHALERVRAGDADWFTRPTVRSYHQVWFELHEDLLATLGIERADEEAMA